MTTEHFLFLFPVYGNLSKINFGKYGLSISRIDSEKILALLTPGVHQRLENQLSYLLQLGLEEHCYAITEKENANNIWNIYYFLRLLKSTYINPVAQLEVSFIKKKGKKSVLQIPRSSTFPLDVKMYIDRPLIIPDSQAALINKMLDNYMSPDINPFFAKLESIYHQALFAEKPYMKFLTLMMVIESLIVDNDTQMITYKIRRLCAVLLGNDKAEGQIIYDNVGKLYGIRSKIVHNADDKKLTKEIMIYLHIIVCELLNTILLSNCDPKILHTMAGQYGYGDRSSILNVLGIKRDKRFIENYAAIVQPLK